MEAPEILSKTLSTIDPDMLTEFMDIENRGNDLIYSLSNLSITHDGSQEKHCSHKDEFVKSNIINNISGTIDPDISIEYIQIDANGNNIIKSSSTLSIDNFIESLLKENNMQPFLVLQNNKNHQIYSADDSTSLDVQECINSCFGGEQVDDLNDKPILDLVQKSDENLQHNNSCNVIVVPPAELLKEKKI